MWPFFYLHTLLFWGLCPQAPGLAADGSGTGNGLQPTPAPSLNDHLGEGLHTVKAVWFLDDLQFIAV